MALNSTGKTQPKQQPLIKTGIRAFMLLSCMTAPPGNPVHLMEPVLTLITRYKWAHTKQALRVPVYHILGLIPGMDRWKTGTVPVPVMLSKSLLTLTQLFLIITHARKYHRLCCGIPRLC